MTKSTPRIKILFVLPSLKAGGAERVISFIASSLDKQKFESVLVVIGKSKDAVYTTDGIEVHFLNKRRVLNAIPLLFKYFLTKKPDVVVGSIAHVNRVLATFSFMFRRPKFVGREASVSSIIRKFKSTTRKFKLPIFRNYYGTLDALICQSHEMADDLVTEYGITKERIYVINNPISGHLPIKNARSSKEGTKQLITIGRLSREKGHERILKTLSKLDFDFQYTIIGNGDQDENIFKLAKDLNMSDKLIYIHHTDDVAKYLAESDVFIQGSYVEGFPNALLESCVVGTPVIAYKALGGTREIVVEGVNGYTVENESEFIEKIKNILFQKEWNPSAVSESVTKKFNKDLILKQYEELFINLVNS